MILQYVISVNKMRDYLTTDVPHSRTYNIGTGHDLYHQKIKSSIGTLYSLNFNDLFASFFERI